MSMYNLLEYSSNYSDTTGSLWCFPKDEATKFDAGIGDNVAFKIFVHKTKLVEEKEAQLAPNNNSGILKNARTANAKLNENLNGQNIVF